MLNIHIDGASRNNPGPAGYGFVATDRAGGVLAEGFGYLGEQTNNYAEYCALIAALEYALQRGWREVAFFSDSELLVRQMSGEYKVKSENLRPLHTEAQRRARRLAVFEIRHIRRSENKAADRLANKAIDERRSNPEFINPVLST